MSVILEFENDNGCLFLLVTFRRAHFQISTEDIFKGQASVSNMSRNKEGRHFCFLDLTPQTLELLC